MHPNHPNHPLDAASHRDPYPYYQHLLTRAPLVYDDDLHLWIAARSSTVCEILDHPACRVRPAAEPVPLSLSGTSAGEVFSRLIRMNDGPGHAPGKLSLERALAGLSDSHVRARSAYLAGLELPGTAEALTDWVYRTPVSVVADLLGFPEIALPEISRLVRDFVACLSPSSSAEKMAQASIAATALQTGLLDLLHATPAEENLLGRVRTAAITANWIDQSAILANLVGLLSQTCEATGGLLGNSLIALAAQPGLLQQVREREHKQEKKHADGWHQLVEETSRHDASVQNTRRFLHQPARIANVNLPEGSTILLVLAAANRDAHANPHPDRFLLDRPQRRVFGFGRGAHACPGRALATCIVSTALAGLFDKLDEPDLARLQWHYLPSANGRLPQFTAAKP